MNNPTRTRASSPAYLQGRDSRIRCPLDSPQARRTRESSFKQHNSASMALEPLSWRVEVMSGARIPTSAVMPNLKNEASLVHSTFYGGTTCTLLR